MVENFRNNLGFSTPTRPDFQQADFTSLPAKQPLPKWHRKRKKALKRSYAERDALLQQLGRMQRDNELLRDIIRMLTAAARHKLDTHTAQTGLALSTPKKRRNGSGSR